MMTDFANWLLTFVKTIFKSLWDFLSDVVVSIVSLFLTALLSLLQALPIPSFLTSGLQNLFNGIPSDVWFFAQHFKLGECMAMFGAAIAFRLARKALTLFQW